MSPEWIGFTAGAMTTLAFLPQVLQVLRTKSTKDISLGMYIIFCTGVFLWITYGFLLGAPSLIFANLLTLILAGTVLVMKLRGMKKS